MDIASLPRHPGQSPELPRAGIPDRRWSVVWLRVAQLAALLVLAAALGWVWWLFYQMFRGGPWVGTFFA